MTKRIITQAELKEILDYDESTGIFTWKKPIGTRSKIGDKAGGKNNKGYIEISLYHYKNKAHRLAWLYMTGEWPKDQIDHINRIKDDNRFCNLREATQSQNQRNATFRKDNSSGFKGVSYNNRDKAWVAQASFNCKLTMLGYFATAELASEAYKKFSKETHGEFYREI